MSHRVETRAGGDVVKAEYAWRSGLDRRVIRIETEGESFLPPEGSASQFITEHYWGYAAQPDGGCLEYEVQHSQWWVWKAKRAAFCGNAAGVYGAGIAKALSHDPDSAFLAKGSPVTVFKGTRIGLTLAEDMAGKSAGHSAQPYFFFFTGGSSTVPNVISESAEYFLYVENRFAILVLKSLPPMITSRFAGSRNVWPLRSCSR